MIELETFSLYKILAKSDVELFSKTREEHYTGYNLTIYKKIVSYFAANQKLPSADEFSNLSSDSVLINYYTNNVLDSEYSSIIMGSDFVVNQLEENYTKRNVLNTLETILDTFEIAESSEIIESIDQLSLDLTSKKQTIEEFYDVSEIELFSNKEDYILFPTGLSNDFDSVNGGFALQELVLLGGRRGSGKSIITLNALRARYEMGHTVALFSIEMRYKEQYNRLMSMVSGVPFLAMYKNELTLDHKLRLAEAKLKFWYKATAEADQVLNKLRTDHDFKDFDRSCVDLAKKDNKFFIIDQVNLNLPKLNHYLRTLSQKYENFSMAAIDYLNIIKIENRLDWKSQILMSDSLKEYARSYNLTIMSPYQIDADGEARFAKGILDSPDLSLIFMPQEKQEKPSDKGQLKVLTAKIRHGVELTFYINMDWSIVKVYPSSGMILNETLLPGEKFGSDSVKDNNVMDLFAA